MTSRVARLRTRAFIKQRCLCFYCKQPMFESDAAAFAKQHGLTIKQALSRRCTAEHLRARRDGGLNTAENIVAACWFCNKRRHSRKNPLSPERYKNHVSREVRRRKWHPAPHSPSPAPLDTHDVHPALIKPSILVDQSASPY